MNSQSTGGAATLLPELSSGGKRTGVYLADLETLKAVAAAAVRDEIAKSAASSTSHVVEQRGPKQEAALDDRSRNLGSSMPSIRGSTSSTSDKWVSVGVRQQEQAVAVKKVAKPKGRLRSGSSTRWETHNKKTCKCAVCCTCRGEMKSSWYKHTQSTCACAVCRQSRREPRPKEALSATLTGEIGGSGGRLCLKPSLPTIPGKRASWVPLELTRTECWACSREFPRHEGLQQAPSPLSSQPQSHPTFASLGSVLNSSSASSPPVRLESCNTTPVMPLSLLQKISVRAEQAADCSSSVRGISPISRSSLASAQKCTFGAQHERPTSERRREFSCCAENSISEQSAFQTKLFSNARCSSGWPNPDHTTGSTRFIGNNSDGVQQCTNDSFNMRQDCEKVAAMSNYCSGGLSWQNSVDRRQDVAGTSTRLHDADPLFVETRKLTATPPLNTWEPGRETTSSAFSTFTERTGQGSRSSSPENMVKTGPNAANSLPDPFLSRVKTTSFLRGHPSSMDHVQPTLYSCSGIFQEMDSQPVCVQLECPKSWSHTMSGRSSSVAEFPFGLEVQVQAEHDVYRPVGDLQAQIHTPSKSFDFDEGNTQSSSPPYETTSPTSMVQDKDNSSHAIDVDSGDTLRSSIAITQGGLERHVILTGVEGGDSSRPGCDKGGRSAKPGAHKFSKRLSNSDGSRSSKRRKREGVSHHVPKWCQLIGPKYDHPAITWQVRRSVPRNFTSPSRALEPSSVKTKENCNSGILNLSGEESRPEGRSRLEESMASDGLQSRDSTGVRESTIIEAARRDVFVVGEENTALRESSQASPSRKKCFVTSPAAEINQMGEAIPKLNGYRTIPERFGLQDTTPMVQCDDDSNDEPEAQEREVIPSLSESVSLPCGQDILMTDISNTARKVRTTICAINGHLGKTVQLTDLPIQNIVAKFGIGCPGRKRSRIELETCSEKRQSRLDASGLLIRQIEDACLLQPLKKHNKGQRHHGVSVGTSSPCSNAKSFFKVDAARGTSSSGHIMKLTVEVVLPESTKVYYLLTRMLKVWTPELTVWVTELVRDITHQSLSTIMVHSPSVPKENTSLCSTPHMLLEALKSYLCQKTTGLVIRSDRGAGLSIHCPSNIGEGKENSIEDRVICTRSRLDEELSSFWHVHCTRNAFLRLPHDRLTVYMEDLISYEVCNRMLKGSSSSSRGRRSLCHSSFSCDSAPNAMNDSAILLGTQMTQSHRGGMTDIHQHQRSRTHEVHFTPLRNMVFQDWIDKPVHGLILLAFPPCFLLKWSPSRLLLCGPIDNMEDNINGEGQHRGQISSDGVISEAVVSLPVNAIKPMEHEESPGSSEFHGKCINATETRTPHVPGLSFQDLLKSVLQADNVLSSPLQNSAESRTELKEQLHQISSNECPTSIPGLDLWESLSDPRNDAPASAAASCSSDSLSKPVRRRGPRRGCPKGGWPKKNEDEKNLYFSAANQDPLDGHATTSQHVADAEADFEVVQSTNTRISSRPDSEFKKKLESDLVRPFQCQELNELEHLSCLRKKLLRHRETRQRVLLVSTAQDGMSYLDYHPDLAEKLADAGTPEERLRLLRGFFFWIQHSCTSGSFKPWAPSVDEADDSDEDCVEIFPQERIGSHVYTTTSTEVEVEVGSRPVKGEQSSSRAGNDMRMTLRTRGQKKKSASQPNKSTYLSKQMKPSVESSVKRERK